jgi:hypothetical protein
MCGEGGCAVVDESDGVVSYDGGAEVKKKSDWETESSEMVRSVVNAEEKLSTVAAEAGRDRIVCDHSVRSESGSSCEVTMPDRSRSASEQ